MSSDEQRAGDGTDEPVADPGPDDSGNAAEDTADRGDNDDAARKDARSKRLVFAGGALAVAAFLAAALFGGLWWAASADDEVDLAQARDEVVRVGRSAVKAFTELDYRNPDQFFDRALQVSTGDVRKQIEDSREANKKTLLEAKTVTTTKVLDLAVDELNEHEGKARFLAALQIEVRQGEKSTVKPIRVECEMTRVEQDGEQAWKLSGIGPVPVVGSRQ
jgi:Mce-associated membrane protein